MNDRFTWNTEITEGLKRCCRGYIIDELWSISLDSSFFLIFVYFFFLLQHISFWLFFNFFCWLGVRKSIWPIKKLSDGLLAWLSIWSVVQMICMWSSWCHRHPIISCFSKIQNGLPVWCRLTQVVLEKRPLNVCMYVCTYVWTVD